MLPCSLVGLQALQLDSRLLELTRLRFRFGTTGPLVFLRPTNAIVTLRKLCFGLEESAARETELLLELCLPFAQSDFHFISAVPCYLEFLLEFALRLLLLGAQSIELAHP